MAWIESHSVLVDHRKVRECASLLGIPKVHFLGHLHAFWHKVIELAEDGDITSWTIEDIAYYAQWEGDSQQFYNALNGRFIDERSRMRNEIGLKNVRGGTRKITMRVVHDWLEYAWRYLYGKYHTAKPERLKEIKNLHEYVGSGLGKPTGKPKSPTQGKPKVSLPTKPTIPTRESIEPKAQEGDLEKEVSPHQSVIKFFFESVEREKGFQPKVDGGDGQATQEMLKKHGVDILKDMISFYIRSDKAKEKGITLKAIFSTHSVNVYLAEQAKKNNSSPPIQVGSPQLEMVKKFREKQEAVHG